MNNKEMTKVICLNCGFEILVEHGFIKGRCSCGRKFTIDVKRVEVEKNTESDEFVSPGEAWEDAFQEIYDAWEKFRDAIYEQLEPIVEKLAGILDKIT